MNHSAQQLFDQWEAAIKSDRIPRRMTEMHDRMKIKEVATHALAELESSLRKVHGRALPSVAVGAVSIWDFAAVVGRAENGEYCIAVGIGSVRLLDVFSGCLCKILFSNSNTDQEMAQNILGSVLYDYARRKIHRLRHWFLDMRLGLALPYGLVDTRLVSPASNSPHHFYLSVLLSWVLAHEICHIARGHVGENDETKILGVIGLPVNIHASRAHERQEHDADLTALRTVFLHYRDRLPPAFTAIAFFLGVLDLIERISTEPLFSSGQHPSPCKRLEHLIESLADAAPWASPQAISELRDLGLDFLQFSRGIANNILKSPAAFREHAVYPEDYEEHPERHEVIDQAAQANNQGDVDFGKGRFVEAMRLYLEAEKLCRGVDYGEGHRIILTNLIQTAFALGNISTSQEWLLQGLAIAKENFDRPTMIYLIRVFKICAERYHANVPVPLEQIRAIGGMLDQDLEIACA